MWEFHSLPFRVADCFVQPTPEKQEQHSFLHKSLQVVFQEHICFQTITSNPGLALCSQVRFEHGSPCNKGVSPPLAPSLLSATVGPCSSVLPRLSGGTLARAVPSDALLGNAPQRPWLRAVPGLRREGGAVRVWLQESSAAGESRIIYAFCFTALSEALLILSCLFFSLLWQRLVISQCVRERRGREGRKNWEFSRKTSHSSQSALSELQLKQIERKGLGCWERCLKQMLL